MLSPVAKNATSRLIRCCSAGVIRERRSFTSVEKSISSTVQVFLMGMLNVSEKRGYLIGGRVRLNPGLRIIESLSYWHASHDSGLSREQLTAWTALSLETGTVALAIFEAGRERR